MKFRRTSFRSAPVRFLTGIAAVGIGSLLIAHTAQAQTGPDTWTGGNGTALWSDGLNWTGTNTPPISGDALTFGTTAGPTTLNNNLTSAAFNIAGLTFSAGAPAYIIGGNDFALTGNTTISVTNNSAVTQTINDNFSMAAGQVFNGNILGPGNITLGGNISGAGGLTAGNINNAAATFLLTLSGNNSYAGGTLIDNGTTPSSATPVVLATSNTALGTGSVTIAPRGNNTNAKLEVSSGITLSNAIIISGRNPASPALESLGGNTNTLTGAVTLQAGGGNYAIQSDAGSVFVLQGGITAGNGAGTGTVRNVTLGGSGNGSESGAITNGTSLVAIIKSGTGTWTLSGPNTYTSGTTITAGKLAVGSNGALGNGAVTMNGGTLTTSANGLTVTAGTGTLKMTASSVLDFGAGNTGDVFKFANSSANPFTGTLSIYDWNGSATGSGLDQLFIGTDATGLTATQLSQITFYSDAGTTALGNVRILSTGEVVASPAAAPEPSEFAAFGLGLLGLGGLIINARKRKAAVA